MIKVSEPAFTFICSSFGIREKDLEFLGGGRGDSDFIHYLGESGIHTAYPEENVNHRLYETYEEEKNIFVAYSMKFYPGKSPSSRELMTDISWHWGKLTGKMHKMTKHYPVWKNLSSNTSDYGYQDEVDFFMDWCKDETVKNEWKKILADNKSITLIDFDVSSCNFFLQDITVPVQGILFDLSGGMINEVFDKEPLKYFLDQFLNGYETENHMDEFWLGQIDTFIQYRRLLLFTCMQDYFNHNLKAKESLLSVIKAGAEVYNLL